MKYYADYHNILKTHHVAEKDGTLRRMPGARISP
jgi:cytochrome b561